MQRFTFLSKPRRDFLLALYGALLCFVADGQMRDKPKRHFHLNASLWALNLACLEDREAQNREPERVISLAKWKRRATCRYAAERILAISGLEVEPAQIESILDELACDLDFAV